MRPGTTSSLQKTTGLIDADTSRNRASDHELSRNPVEQLSPTFPVEREEGLKQTPLLTGHSRDAVRTAIRSKSRGARVGVRRHA